MAVLPVTVEYGGDKYEIPDLFALPLGDRIWLEEKTGSLLPEFFADEARLLAGSAKHAAALAALAVGTARDRSPDDVYRDVLGARDGDVKLTVGADTEGEAGPTEPEPAPKPKRARSGAQNS